MSDIDDKFIRDLQHLMAKNINDLFMRGVMFPALGVTAKTAPVPEMVCTIKTFQDAIEKLPPPPKNPIEAIVVNVILDGIKRVTVGDKTYIYIHLDTWNAEVEPKLKKYPDTDGMGIMGGLYGIPVIFRLPLPPEEEQVEP